MEARGAVTARADAAAEEHVASTTSQDADTLIADALDEQPARAAGPDAGPPPTPQALPAPHRTSPRSAGPPEVRRTSRCSGRLS